MKDIINCQTAKGKTLLHLAIEKDDEELCAFLVEKGINLNIRYGNDRNTFLHMATDNVKILELFKICGVDSKNFRNETPLHKAAKYNCVKMIDFLLSKYVFYQEFLKLNLFFFNFEDDYLKAIVPTY